VSVGKIDNVATLSISRRQAIMVTLGLAVVLLLGARWLDRSETTTAPAAAPVRVRAGPAVRPTVVVDVAGAVRRPGLYKLPDGSRVADALQRAGGPTPKAFVEALNLAAPLADGQQVLVPREGAAAGVAAAAAQTAGPVSLSAATLEQLDTLPGVGPVTAQKILDYQTAHGAFRSVEELDAVPGIGPATIENLRELVVP
jgi:competence protein ComEA